MRTLLKDLGQEQKHPTTIYEDNRSAIALANNPASHQRTKHIDLQYHFIREKIKDKQIVVQHTSTETQLADAMTKALGRNQFTIFINQVLTNKQSTV